MFRDNLSNLDPRNVLFGDRKPTGSPFTISMAQMRMFDIELETGLLNEIQKWYWKNSQQKNLDVVASCDFNHVTNVFNVSLDNIKDATMQNHSKFFANLKVSLGIMDDVTPEELQKLSKFLEDNYSRKLEHIRIFNFLALHVAICYQTNIPDFESCLLHVTLVHPTHEFELQPISKLNMANCAFSKNFENQRGMRPMSGFLMLNNDRQMVPLMRSDKNISIAPLVGVWVAGVDDVNDVMVWASLLQYSSNLNLQNRICKTPDSFILLFYSHHPPFLNYFECKLTRCQPNSSFLVGQANVMLKNLQRLPNSRVCVRLSLPQLGSSRHELFQSVMKANQRTLQRSQTSVKERRNVHGGADLIPRPVLPSKEREIPLIAASHVPEMTLLCDDPLLHVKSLKSHSNRDTLSRTSTPNIHHKIPSLGPRSPSPLSNPHQNQFVWNNNFHGRADSRQNNGHSEFKRNLMDGKHSNGMTIASRVAATSQRSMDKPVLNQNPIGKPNGMINTPCQIRSHVTESSQAQIPPKMVDQSPVDQQLYNDPSIIPVDTPQHLQRHNFSEKIPKDLPDPFQLTNVQPMVSRNQYAVHNCSSNNIKDPNECNLSKRNTSHASAQVNKNSPKLSFSADFQQNSASNNQNTNSEDIVHLIEKVMPGLLEKINCSAISGETSSQTISTSFTGDSDILKNGRIKDEASGGSVVQCSSHPRISFSNFKEDSVCSGVFSHSSHDITLDYPSFSSKMEDISDYSARNQTVFESPQDIGTDYHALSKCVQRLIGSISGSESLQIDADSNHQIPTNQGKFFLSDYHNIEDYSEEESCSYGLQGPQCDGLEDLWTFLKDLGVDISLDDFREKNVTELTQYLNSLDGDIKLRGPSDKTIRFEQFAGKYVQEPKSRKKKMGPSKESIYFHSYENKYITKNDPPMKNKQKDVNSIIWSSSQQDTKKDINVLGPSNKSNQNVSSRQENSEMWHEGVRRTRQQDWKEVVPNESTKSHSRQTYRM